MDLLLLLLLLLAFMDVRNSAVLQRFGPMTPCKHSKGADREVATHTHRPTAVDFSFYCTSCFFFFTA